MSAHSRSLVEREIDRLFKQLNVTHGNIAPNPITGGSFMWGVDPIAVQKKEAALLLLAREKFALIGPADAPLLPLSEEEVDDYRNARGLVGVVGFFARSLSIRDYDFAKHPTFNDFARGLMATNTGMWGIEKDKAMRNRFPPRPLTGMTPGAYWAPPKEYAETMASHDRATKRLVCKPTKLRG